MATRKKTGGRKKGTPNKLTTSARSAVLEVFQECGDVPAMVKWAKNNRTQFYLIFAKLISTQITGKDDGPMEFKNVTDANLDREIAAEQAAIAGAVAGEAAAAGGGGEA